MTKIIPLSINKDYAHAIGQAISTLEEMEDDIKSAMIGLATTGKWKKWSDEQPIGTEFTFTEEMLRDTGDENVDLLCDLVDKIEEIMVKLKPKSPQIITLS
jgi:hypothetical protein